MSPKKKATPPAPTPKPIDPEAAMKDLDFHSLEEKIRGEEILIDAETRSLREAREVKKKLDESEIDRRMEALRNKVGRKK